MSSPMPALSVQIAFASAPIGGSYTWVDISEYVRDVWTKRGRQHVLSRFEAGRATILLNNRDGRFDPTNTASPYWPNVDLNRRIQVLAGGSATPLFTGFVDSWTPKWPDQVSSDIEVIASDGSRLLGLDPVVSSYKATVLADGASHLWVLDDSASDTTAADAVGAAIGNYRGDYTRLAQGPSYTDGAGAISLGTAGGKVVLPSIGTLSAPVSYESWFRSTTIPASGHSANLIATDAPPDQSEPLNVIQQLRLTYRDDGSLQHNLTVPISTQDGNTLLFTIASSGLQHEPFGVPVVTDTAGNVWTLLVRQNGKLVDGTDSGGSLIFMSVNAKAVSSISVQIQYNIGQVQLQALELAGNFSTVDASGGIGYYSGTTFSVTSPALAVAGEVFVGVVMSWTGGSLYPITISGPSGSQVEDDRGDMAAAVLVTPPLASASAVTFSGSTSGATVKAVAYVTMRPPTVPAYHMLRVRKNPDPTAQPSSIVEADSFDGTTLTAVRSKTTTPNVTDGLWHHTVLTIDGSNVMRLYVDGVLVSSTAGAAGSVATAGLALSHGYNNLVGDLAYSAIYPSALSAAQVLTHYQKGFTGYPVQDASARIATVLADIGWPGADESLQAGLSLIAQPTGSLTTSGVWAYLQDVERAEQGSLFLDATGKVTFFNRYHTLLSTSAITLGDGAGEIPYKTKPDFPFDNVDLFNASAGQRTGGVLQRADDATSQARYGVASSLTEANLLLTTDFEVLSRTQWNVQRYANPVTRVAAITVDVLGDVPNRFTQVALRELRDRVTVKRRPYATPAGYPTSQFSQDSSIEGIEHKIDFSKKTWMVTLRLWAVDPLLYWTLGDATLGALGTSTRLAW